MTCEMLQHYIDTAPDEATRAALYAQWLAKGCDLVEQDDAPAGNEATT